MAAAPDAEFPLLQLPYLGQKLVVWTMSTSEKIRYSLLSENAKKLIQSLPRHVEYLEFFLDDLKIQIGCNLEDTIEMRLPERTDDGDVELSEEKPEKVKDFWKQKLAEAKPEFSLKEWVVHISDVLRCNKIKLFFQGGSGQYKMQSIQQLFQGMEIIGVGVQDTGYEHAREVFNEFPDVRELTFGSKSLRNDMIDALVSRDLDYFKCGRQFDIQALLKMNCKVIEISPADLSLGGVNQLLRSWSSMSTNRNLEVFSVLLFKTEFDESNYLEQIFVGVQYTVVPKESYREFRTSYVTHLWEFVDVIIGQFEIQRDDGVKARIQFLVG
ncbi:hypothetical protein CRE_02456 [Caenorhabditis remanei]|uniref:Sdz-33 F-box domain-containing protein n=1 Tax=Caenorhabditis remanei TaxID=31234 RepID=E3MIV3_CAERE|nr:hypothetical protein CRE_02456 [Caenorhabditis remanei]